MSRWNLQARHQTPQSRLMEPEQDTDHRRLTSSEVRCARLRLAHDMVALTLQDGQGLPSQLRLELRAIYEALVAVRRATRSLP